MSTKRCYYETLEVERSADEPGLKTAFRKLAMKWHPDKNPGDQSSEVRFKEINEAYEVLKDPQKRAAYDRFGHAAFEQGWAAAGARLRQRFRLGLQRHLRRHLRDGGRAPLRRPRARRGPSLQHGDHARGSVLRQDRAGAHPDVDDVRGVLGNGREGRLETEELRDLRRRRPHPPGAGLLPGGAHVSDLSWPRPDDRGSVHLVHRLRPRHARARAVGEHSGRRRGRHAHSPRRRRRGRRAWWAAGRPLHLPVARAA